MNLMEPPVTIVDPRAARAAIGGLLLRYNKGQRRDRQGQWTDGPSGPSADLTKPNIEMDASEREFLSDYVEDGATYRRINDALRGQTPVTPEMADKVKQLDNLVGRASLDGDATLYRAISVKSTDPIMGQVFGEGGSWTDPGFGSASGDRSAVDDFRGVGDQAIVFEISAKKGQPVLVLGDDLSDRAMMQTSQEVLLPRGYRLEFDSVSSRRRDGIMVNTVKATLVDPDPLVEAFAFNPNQRRGPNGKWIKVGGGLGAPDAPKTRPFDVNPDRPPTLSDGSTGLKEGRAAWTAAQRPEQAAEWVEQDDRRLARQIPHAAVYYTSDGYRDLNRNLRQNRPVREEEEEYVQALDAAMGESAMRSESATWRGVYDGDGMFSREAMQESLVGAEWVDPAYVSTSARPEFIESFARPGWDNAVAMRMLLPWGTQALRLGEWGQEAEVLLGRGNRYRVIADYGKVDGVRRIDVEVTQGDPLPKYRRADADNDYR